MNEEMEPETRQGKKERLNGLKKARNKQQKR